MLAGSNPAARTRQSQSPRSPYRGAGRLFCTRFAGSMTSRRHQIMICGSSLSMPSFLFNRLITICGSPPHQSPRLPYRFSVPPHRIALFDPPCRTTIRLGGTRCRCPPSRVSFPIGGEARPRSSTRFSIRPIGFSPSSSPRFPPGGSASPLLSAFLYGRRGGYVFFARISFSRRFRRDM